jgi:hypothetical protein
MGEMWRLGDVLHYASVLLAVITCISTSSYCWPSQLQHGFPSLFSNFLCGYD